jgi:hypothetical protein
MLNLALHKMEPARRKIKRKNSPFRSVH